MLASTLGGAEQFIKLDLHGFAVAVLGILDQEHHQEGDYCGASIDDELPGVGVVKHWSGTGPNEDDEQCAHKHDR